MAVKTRNEPWGVNRNCSLKEGKMKHIFCNVCHEMSEFRVNAAILISNQYHYLVVCKKCGALTERGDKDDEALLHGMRQSSPPLSDDRED